MIRRLDLRGMPAGRSTDDRPLIPRAPFDLEAAVDAVRPVCADVHERGVEAVRDATRRFDGVDLEHLRVAGDAIERAYAALDARVKEALEESIERLRTTCEAELDADVTTDFGSGASVTRRVLPIERVGLYVPGGLAPLVSSVVMNVVPARVAGVASIALSSPPQPDADGLPHPTVLAACHLLGVDEVYPVGGAQAIAMFAYGAGECRPVDLVTGPGNIYVAAAKRLLKGVVGIDAEAGPTEIVVLADESANATYVAADLISQAEHDPLAASVLVTDSDELADAVDAELDRQVAAAPHASRIEKALSAEQSATVLVGDIGHGLDVVNAYGAEHLEIQTREAAAVAEGVRNAGAVFVGPFSPVSLGDYSAGSNHVLPTAGSARYSSGLSVRAFTRTMQVVTYDRAALERVGDAVEALAAAEDLPSHGTAVSVRLGSSD